MNKDSLDSKVIADIEKEVKDKKLELTEEALTAIQPLPILNAEQMIIEAAIVNKENQENVEKVINLLKNAEYQLTLAGQMGYGKKDKEYSLLSKSIDSLKKSVKKKENSESKFELLKEEIIKFKERLFSSKTKS